jgi:hypothetical protein
MTYRSEIYDNYDFKQYIQAKAHSPSKKHWKLVLEEGIKHKIALEGLLESFISKEKIKRFIFYFYETLRGKSFFIYQME